MSFGLALPVIIIRSIKGIDTSLAYCFKASRAILEGMSSVKAFIIRSGKYLF